MPQPRRAGGGLSDDRDWGGHSEKCGCQQEASGLHRDLLEVLGLGKITAPGIQHDIDSNQI